MDSFWIMLKNVLLFVALAVPGYLLVRRGTLKLKDSGPLSAVMMNVGLPFLIVSGTTKLQFDRALLVTLSITAALGIVLFFIFYFLSTALTGMEKDPKKQGMMRFCAVFPNNGFMGIPLALAVFGGDAPVMTVLILLNIITNILMFTLGAFLVSGDKKSMSLKKALTNPVLMAALAGTVLNLTNIPDRIPEVTTFVSHLSGLVVPGSMIVLGMKLGGVPFKKIFACKRTYYVSFLKLVLFPVAACILIHVLSVFFGQIRMEGLLPGFFFAFAMPTAGLASAFADRFDGDGENAAAFTLGSTILSVISIPALYWILSAVT